MSARYGHRMNRQRRGFTMMELMVSVAILIGLLAMVATVFSTASRAGGVATASTTVHRYLSQAVSVIEADLKAMDPATSVMGIQGVIINAPESETNPLRSVHRSDVLMLITPRPTDPYVFDRGTANKTNLDDDVQVVYGHADLGRIANNGQFNAGTIKAIEAGNVPAAQWHLTRRVVSFVSEPFKGGAFGFSNNVLTHTDFRYGYADLATYPLGSTLTTGPPVSMPLLENTLLRSQFSGDVNYFFSENGNNYYDGTQVSLNFYYGVTNYNGYIYPFPSGQFLIEGGYWWDRDGANSWSRTQTPPTTPITRPDPSNAVLSYAAGLDEILFYDRSSSATNRRSVIDPEPPIGNTAAVAMHFLPACSEFKVEYSYDDPNEMRQDPTSGDISAIFAHPVRWHTLAPGEQIIWSKISSSATDPTDPRRWPRAIRITLKAWDTGDRLNEPVTRTIIHTWN